MHVAGHAGRHHPRRDRARIEKRAIDDRAGRVHAATDAGRAHARTLARAAKLRNLRLSRVTLDFDGTVLTTGYKVGWAFRGYNPHKRYAPSYYPLLCHVAQTGQFLHVRNRPGNVHDSKGALAVI
jgi:hypothetical protein